MSKIITNFAVDYIQKLIFVKKLLYVAMAAIVLMACNQEKPDLVKSDAKLFETGGQRTINLLGLDSETIDTKLVDLGFTQLEGVGPIFAQKRLPNRLLQPAKNTDLPWTAVTYVYNAPGERVVRELDAYNEMRFRNLIADSKKVYIELYVYYEDEACIGVIALTEAGLDVPKINYACLNFCENLNNQVMNVKGKGDTEGEWAAAIFDYDELTGEMQQQVLFSFMTYEPDDVLNIDEDQEGVLLITDTYADWSKEFLAQDNDFTLVSISNGTAVHATEERDIEYRYGTLWEQPSDERAEEDREAGVAPMVMGMYCLVDVDSQWAEVITNL